MNLKVSKWNFYTVLEDDKKGFAAGRNISEANRMLKDVIYYSEREKINSSIIFLDYQEAFDRIECLWT